MLKVKCMVAKLVTLMQRSMRWLYPRSVIRHFFDAWGKNARLGFDTNSLRTHITWRFGSRGWYKF
jgi:hypothetical protein